MAKTDGKVNQGVVVRTADTHPATYDEIGVSRQRVAEWRKLRDASCAASCDATGASHAAGACTGGSGDRERWKQADASGSVGTSNRRGSGGSAIAEGLERRDIPVSIVWRFLSPLSALLQSSTNRRSITANAPAAEPGIMENRSLRCLANSQRHALNLPILKADYQRNGRNLPYEAVRSLFAVRKQTHVDRRARHLCNRINERLMVGMCPRGRAERRIV